MFWRSAVPASATSCPAIATLRPSAGFPVEVHHRDKDDSEQRLEGLLLERDADTLQINIRGRIKRIPRDCVIGVRLTSPGS